MQRRLFIAFALIALVSIATITVIARQSTAREVRAFMFRGNMINPDDLASALEKYYLSTGSWENVESQIRSFSRGKGQGGMGQMMRQHLRLADETGRLIVDTASSPPMGSLTSQEIANSITLKQNGQTIGYLAIEGGMNFTVTDSQFLLNRLNRAALTAGLVAVSISLLLAIILAYQILRPIKSMTYAAQRLGEGDLGQRVAANGSDELATLAIAFNHMADSLQQAEKSRRAMTADIAHELRNPLAVQLANLEALQDGIYPLTPENLQPVLEQNLLLTRLVDDLRTLALADSGQLTLERTATDLNALIEKVVDHFRPQATSQKIILEIQLLAGAIPLMNLDSTRIEQIIGNLLSNALRYSPENGTIQIATSREANSVMVTISDEGPGISAEDLPFVFDRFYRGDRARARAEGGTGLGLAIARQFAEAHQGSLTAANNRDGGSIFTLSLPIVIDQEKK